MLEDREETIMISEKMKGYVKNSSVIRAMFEEGKKMAAIYGADHVYDFSLGNPNVPAPDAVKEAIIDIVTNEDPVLVHGYMSNSGFEDVRTKIAEHLNAQYGTSYTFNNLVMIVGAAGGMNVFFKTLLNPGDEVVTFSPYFGEYRAYVSNFDGKLVEVQATLMPDTKSGTPGADAVKVKGNITWVAVADAVPVEVRLYERLFTTEQPGSGELLDELNKASLVTCSAFAEPSLALAKVGGAGFQFEGHGYFVLDAKASHDGKLVFNRAAGMRDSQGKIGQHMVSSPVKSSHPPE